MVKRNKAKRRGSSKAGRPRKDGVRYLSGDRKPVGPNALMLARREFLCPGAPNTASNPLDVALANKWISESEYRWALIYAGLCRANVGGPRLGNGTGGMEATPLLETSGRSFSAMEDVEVASIWDAVFNDVEVSPVDAAERAMKAKARWITASNHMTPRQRNEVHAIAVMDQWPPWVTSWAAARAMREALKLAKLEPDAEQAASLAKWEGPANKARHRLFLAGLAAIRGALKPTALTPPAPAIESQPYTPTPGRKAEEVTNYIDTAGAPVFTAVRRVPVGGK